VKELLKSDVKAFDVPTTPAEGATRGNGEGYDVPAGFWDMAHTKGPKTLRYNVPARPWPGARRQPVDPDGDVDDSPTAYSGGF